MKVHTLLAGAGFVLVLATGAAWWIQPPGPSGAPFVAGAILSRALASRVPERPTLSDEIEFFEARLAADPADPLARRRLSSAGRLRYQAYGRVADLELASRYTEDPMSRSAIHLAKHEFSAAVESAERALEAARGDERIPARLRLFDAYFAVGEFEAAEVELSRLPDEAAFGILARRARWLDRAGHTEQAREAQRKATELAIAYSEPAAVRAWSLVELAHFEHHTGRPERAVPLLSEALVLLPGSPAALEALGWIAYAVDQDLDAADALFSRAGEAGGHLDLMLVRGDIAELRGEQGRAAELRRSFLEEARADAATERLYRREIALALADHGPAGMLPEALRLVEADLADRKDAGTRAAHGSVLHRAGQLAASQVAFEQALSFGIPEPQVYLRAGFAAIERGDTEEGRRLLDAAIEAEAEIGPAATQRARAALTP